MPAFARRGAVQIRNMSASSPASSFSADGHEVSAPRWPHVPWWLAAALACVVWAALSTLANGHLDSKFDMLENYAWSQPFRWGTHKHPPLFAWVMGT